MSRIYTYQYAGQNVYRIRLEDESTQEMRVDRVILVATAAKTCDPAYLCTALQAAHSGDDGKAWDVAFPNTGQTDFAAAVRILETESPLTLNDHSVWEPRDFRLAWEAEVGASDDFLCYCLR